ncbi:MAG: hypothetical protein AAF810_17305 [Cyanobacteria bacterium P01_D01_bin.36]
MTITVNSDLTSVAKFAIKKDSNVIALNLINTGVQPLSALKIKVFVEHDDPDIIIIDTDAEWSAPASGSAIQHAEQRSSTGARETIAPTTLPAGSQIFFALATTTSYVRGLHSIEILAQTAAGQATSLDVYVGRA